MEGTPMPPNSDGSAQQNQPVQPAQPAQPLQTPPPLPPEPSDATEPAIQPTPWVPGYPGYYQGGYQNSYQSGYLGMPPQPQDSALVSAPSRRARWSLIAIGAVLALLVTLAAGLAGGVAIGRATALSPSSGNTVVLGSTSAPNVTVSSSTTTLQQDVQNVAKAVAPSVVKITANSTSGQSIGSGDILTSDGYIITNDHVVRGGGSFIVQLSNGKTYNAQLIGEAPQDDLAVLKIAATGLRPIAFADSSKVQVGEFAIAIGNPLNLGESVTFGIVSQVNQTASESPSGPARTLTGMIQTSAPINPGNSGGALVNLKGQLIGIPTLAAVNPEARGSTTSIGLAISSNRVQFVAKQLIAQGNVTSTGQGFLGIEAQDVTPAVAAADGLSVQSGVLVRSFVNDAAGESPAQQAGLRAGDVITAVNGTTITDNSDLAGALQNQAPGTKVTLTIVRGSSTITISVKLGERPVSAQG